MAQLVGLIRVNEGIVLGADCGTFEIDSNIIKINDAVVALAVDDFKSGASLCGKISSSLGTGGFEEAIGSAVKILTDPKNPFMSKVITLLFAGYDQLGREKDHFVIKFDGTKITSENPLQIDVVFSSDDTLARYLCHKVLTRSMPLEQALTLMAYILMQYNQILQTGRNISLATISEKGFKMLDHDETRQVIHEAEKKSTDIKRGSYDILTKKFNMERRE